MLGVSKLDIKRNRDDSFLIIRKGARATMLDEVNLNASRLGAQCQNENVGATIAETKNITGDHSVQRHGGSPTDCSRRSSLSPSKRC